MSKLTRYQNPEVFEPLAMAYAAGTLQGRARGRFETLMNEHFYLKATTEAYETTFAPLVELLPEEKPSDRVWKNLQHEIAASAPQKGSLLKRLFAWASTPKYASALAGIAVLAVALAVVLNPLSKQSTDTQGQVAKAQPESQTAEPTGFIAKLQPNQNQSGGAAIARITKESLSLELEIEEPLQLASADVELQLWCHPKNNNGKPMMMGVINASGKTILKIDQAEWNAMKDVGMLEIIAKPKDGEKLHHSPSLSPRRAIMLQGTLNSITI